jgi:RNA polymerase sigma-70 factor (ECF subfamily)
MVQAQDTLAATDHELVGRFKRGEPAAFDEIVLRYSTKVLTICSYYLKDSHEAHDVSQEVFIKVHRGLPAFREEAKLSTWIHTIAINTCKNQVSFFRRLFARRADIDEETLIRSPNPGPDEDVETRERDRILRDEIQRLPAKFKEIVILKDIQNRSYEEIGEMLSINQGTVKSRLHRAREALAERLRRTKAF